MLPCLRLDTQRHPVAQQFCADPFTVQIQDKKRAPEGAL
jgi:hypothetical protein